MFTIWAIVEMFNFGPTQMNTAGSEEGKCENEDDEKPSAGSTAIIQHIIS